jgi:4-hydroxy-tetrahydrodipicolinate synthase
MNLSGCFTAIVTPVDRSGYVDERTLAAHADWMINEGVSGVVACGTTGEAATLSEDEQHRVMNVVVEAAAGRVPVIAGVGSNNTAASVNAIRRAIKETSVDAFMAVVPYYSKPSQAGIRAHFEAVIDASDRPVVLYNVPGRTVVSMTAETMASLAQDPRVVAIKEASGDMVLGSRTLDATGDNARIFSGDDPTTLPFLALGGSGCISVVSNCAPRLMSELCDAVQSGELARARALQPLVLDWSALLFGEPNPVPTKLVCEHLGFGQAAVRLPHVLPSEAVTASICESATALLSRTV